MAGNVSNISGIMAQKMAKVNPAKETKQEIEEAVASFQSLLMQQPMAQGTNVSGDASESVQPVQDTQKKQKELESAFEKAGAKTDSTRIEKAPREEVQKAPEELEEVKDAIEDGIREILTDEAQVTEEQLEEAMETLDLELIDLTVPENLMAAIEEATGTEDSTELLLTLDLNQIKHQINELVENLTEENGVSIEDLKALGMTESMDPLTEGDLPEADFVMPENPEGTEVIPDANAAISAPAGTESTVTEPTGQMAADTEEKQVPLKEEEAVTEAAEETEEAPSVGKPFKESEPKAEEIRTALAPEEPAEKPVDAAEKAPAQKDASGSQNFEGSKQPETGILKQPEEEEASKLLTRHDGSHAAVPEAAPQNVQQTVAPEQQVNAPRPVVNPQEIMSQFAEFARTQISADSSSFELQLNPASLGRILINVTEQQGNVTARIETANQEVKEVLETQIVNLRANLENAGVKVNQVEVTVASHEFERNLEEGNASQAGAEGQDENREEKGGSARRTLRADDLKGLSGLMSEEEQLAAQIMIDNGNTMDARA